MAQFRHREGLFSMPFTFDNYLGIVKSLLREDKTVFIKHNVYFSLEKALEMAEFENLHKIKSSYLISFSSPFYNAMNKDSIEKIRMIKSLGHGIGLHFDIGVIQNEEKELDTISAQKFMMEAYISSHIDYITFRGKPIPSYEFTTKVQLQGLICPDYDTRYSHISDSINDIEINPEDIKVRERFLLGVQPIWWGEEAMDWQERLASLELNKKIEKAMHKEVEELEQSI